MAGSDAPIIVRRVPYRLEKRISVLFEGGSIKSQDFRPPSAALMNPLIERLEKFVTLSVGEDAAIRALSGARRTFRTSENLVREGTAPNRVCLILSGVGFRYRYLANGRRQIFGYLLPGDLCDAHFMILKECDHNVGALCDTEVTVISLHELSDVMDRFPKIRRAFHLISLMEGAMLRECLLNVGQRNAPQKVAHFVCEMRARFLALGLCNETEGFDMPVTQVELADTLGLTVVHVNRVLQRFRHEGLLRWSRRHVNILNYPGLERLADFDPAYLRLRHVERQKDEAAMNFAVLPDIKKAVRSDRLFI